MLVGADNVIGRRQIGAGDESEKCNELEESDDFDYNEWFVLFIY